MGVLFARLGTSSQDVARSTPSSLPEPPRTTAAASPAGAAGSPEESKTITQKSIDAIFMFRRALNTSLAKKWMATTLILQEKLTRMKNED